jgi:hypothetical protein
MAPFVRHLPRHARFLLPSHLTKNNENDGIAYSFGDVQGLGDGLGVPEGVLVIQRQELLQSVNVPAVLCRLDAGLHLIDQVAQT